MNRLTDKENFRRYLLGELDARARARLEVSLADDQVYEKFLASEQQLIDEYARGELTRREAELFEVNYLQSSPEVGQRVAVAAASLSLAPSLVASRAAAEPEGAVMPSGLDRIKEFFRRLRVPKAVYASLALLLTVAALAVLLWRAKSSDSARMREVEVLRENLEENSLRLRELEENLRRVREESAARQGHDDETITKLRRELEMRSRLEDRLREELSRRRAAPALTFASFTLSPFGTKGTGEQEKYPLAKDVTRVRLSLLLRNDGREYARYQVKLNGEVAGENVRASRTKSGTSVSITVRSAKLNEGTNSVELLGLNRDGQYEPVEGYVLRVTKR